MLRDKKDKKNRMQETVLRLRSWFPEHKRDLPWRADTEPYHVWLSEIMLQQTRVEAVREYYRRFLLTLPTLRDLAEVSEDELLKLWQGLGYYNRARNLKKAAQTVVREYGGKFPETYEEIRRLSGIGDYTAAAIGAICFDLKRPAVDGNVLRVYSRILADERVVDLAATKRQVCQELTEVYPESGSGDTNQAFMELGATVCVPNGAPRCEVCPVADICAARAEASWKRYPVRQEKKKRKLVKRTVLVLICDGRVAIRRREDKGLLASLWEFPAAERELSEQGAAHFAAELGLSSVSLKMKTGYTHIFTHVEWQMEAYYMEVETMSEEFVWATPRELSEVYALPSAFTPFLEVLKGSILADGDWEGRKD